MEYTLPSLTPGTTSFGVVSLLMFSNESSIKNQTGFSIDRDGNPIFGFDEGDWQEGWYVIGIDQNCFDPIFIDLNDPDLPIYKASASMGSWEENLICENYQSFLKSLKLVENLKTKYQSCETVPDEEVQSFMANIKNNIGDGNLYFWGMFIQLEERGIELSI
jgi:hypothetical protein